MEARAAANLKRPRSPSDAAESLPDSLDSDFPERLHPASIGEGAPVKSHNAGEPGHRKRHHRMEPSPSDASNADGDSGVDFLEIHEVQCNNDGRDHHGHFPTAYFFDHPRLNAGDCRLSPLHGMFPLEQSLDEYVRDRPDISFVVLKSYDCESYHQLLQDEFQKLLPPYLPGRESATAARYYEVLKQPGPPANPFLEQIQHPSRPLVRAMKQLVAHDSKTFGGWDIPEHLEAPYVQFYHVRETMMLISKNVVDSTGLPHISVLLQYLDFSFGAEYEEANDLFKRGLVNLKHLPKLFRANDIVVATEYGQPRGYTTTLCQAKGHSVSIECSTWSFDGSFRKTEDQLNVKWYHDDDDEVLITTLSVYPLRYDTSGLRDRLLKRGGIFWSCRGRRFISYAPPRRTFEIRPANLRYMVDMETYKHIHEDNEADHGPREGELDQHLMDSETPPSDEFTLQLPSRIRGFGLHDKKWRFLQVDHIQDIKWNKSAFDRLVLDPDKKSLITAMVNEHVLSDMSADVIEGKGNGLIILLHGGPGTGKTLTAESVAELAEKPLYRVTCGDIGTDAEAVEKYLESVLHIGTIWKAVVLFDESDVFLEERSQADLQRNALVSVFLRVLEYYDGILILTSNRVGTFDEAFKSRVQLALHYPAINESGREEIWLEFIQDLQKQGANANYEQLRSKISVLARNRLNGRQIRNAIRTARQLASQSNQPLSYDHLKKAIKVAHEFEQYVVETHGGQTDEDFAKTQNIRVR